ncbi:MAG: leucine-rich repeat domain-containing protein, partial [Ignavibacteria bacterium]|nr:leucine-rich repeat domain-containing protein [Ignavibacteria bacterium]
MNSAGVLTKYTGSGGNVIIPETVDGITVTSIGYTAFYDCSSLTSVIIPNSAVRIGFCAFGNCSNLLSVAIPNSITTIEDFAFLDCSELISVTIPDKVITIGTGVFAKCTNLQEIVANSQNDFYLSIEGVLYNKDTTSIVCYPGGKQGEFTIPNSVTTIGKGAFAGCTNLTSVIIPNTVTSIDQNAFAYSGLTSITIPDLVTTIGSSTFAGCSYLLSVAIPESVTVINVETFKDCNNLSSVFIPHSVTQIHEWAFDGCNTLSSITLPSSIKYIGEYNVFPENLKTLTVEWSYPPNIHLGMLGSTKSACVLRVPTGSKQAYQESSFWKDFKNIEEYDFSSVYTGNLT